jgi:hypothetical protein
MRVGGSHTSRTASVRALSPLHSLGHVQQLVVVPPALLLGTQLIIFFAVRAFPRSDGMSYCETSLTQLQSLYPLYPDRCRELFENLILSECVVRKLTLYHVAGPGLSHCCMQYSYASYFTLFSRFFSRYRFYFSHEF